MDLSGPRRSERKKKEPLRYEPAPLPLRKARRVKSETEEEIIEIQSKKDPNRHLTDEEILNLVDIYGDDMAYADRRDCDHIKEPRLETTKDEKNPSNISEVIFYNDKTYGNTVFNKLFGADVKPEDLKFYYFINPEKQPHEEEPIIDIAKPYPVKVSSSHRVVINGKQENHSILSTPYEGKTYKIKKAGSYFDALRNKQMPWFYIESGTVFDRVDENCRPVLRMKPYYGTIINNKHIPEGILSFGKKRKKVKKVKFSIKLIKKDILFLSK